MSPARVLDFMRRLLRGIGGPAPAGQAMPALPDTQRLPTEGEASIGGTPSSRLASVATLRQAALENSDVLGAIRLISEEIAGTPVKLSKDVGGKTVDIENHAALDFLARHVLGYSLEDYVQQMVSEALVAGEAFSEIRGRPSRLLPGLGVLIAHDSASVDTEVTPDHLRVARYSVTTGGSYYHVAPARMVHWALNPIRGGASRFNGVSPIYPLLRRLQSAREDEAHLRDSPRNAPRNLLITIDPSAEKQSMADVASKLQTMAGIRDRTGYHVALSGLKVESLTVDSVEEDLDARQVRLSELVTLAFDLAPVLRNQSVTNDSAAHEQYKHFRRALRWLAADMWAAHGPLLAMLLSPEEVQAGIYLRSDWTADMDAEAREDRHSRLKIIAMHIANGADPVAAYEAEGVPYPGGRPVAVAESAPDEGMTLRRVK
ncbi:MAG: phage portal protein [Miltoncostaeaceae bacterium]